MLATASASVGGSSSRVAVRRLIQQPSTLRAFSSTETYKPTLVNRRENEMGLGGRASDAGLKVAIFGASGFLGPYVCTELGTKVHNGVVLLVIDGEECGRSVDVQEIKARLLLGADWLSPAVALLICLLISHVSLSSDWLTLLVYLPPYSLLVINRH